MEEKLIELRPPSLVEDNDLAIQHSFTIQIQMNGRAQIEEALIRVPFA